jgi:hypothetical protein
MIDPDKIRREARSRAKSEMDCSIRRQIENMRAYNSEKKAEEDRKKTEG